MSGRIVIDILSSPDQPPPPRAVVSRNAPAAKARAEEYVTVSSSDDDRPPPVQLASKNLISAISTSKPATSTTVANPATTKPPSAIAKPQDEFLFHSDDFDSTVNLDSSAVKYDDDPFASDPPLPPAKKRRVSISPKPARGSFGTFKRTKTTGSAVPVDHITFTSSPDHVAEAARRRKEKQARSRKDDLEEEVGFGGEQVVSKARNCKEPSWDFGALDNLAETDEDDEDLPDLASLPQVYKPMSQSTSKPTSKSTTSQRALNNYKAVKAKDNAEKEKHDRAKEKAEKSKEKAAAKEAEKEEKLREKEKKAYEKKLATELAKVNTLKTDKKVSTPEMIVDLPSSLDSMLLAQAYKMLRLHEVEYRDWESVLPVIKWRRKVTATYNEEAGHWEPTPLKIKKERHIMCVLTAQVLVDLITGPEGHDLETYTLRLKAQFEPCEVIYLVEGFMKWMRTNNTVQNRQYTAAVRSHTQEEVPTSSQKKKKKKDAGYVNEDLIEDALLRLQINHNAFIHHTNAMVETAEWILGFTQHISSIPYKTQRFSIDTGFCMDTGQVKTGSDATDTYVRMLQEVFRVTAPIAYGIVAEFPTLRELVKVLEEQGPLALEDCRKSTNKDGAFSDKRIGPAISRKIHRVFRERDPGVWIV